MKHILLVSFFSTFFAVLFSQSIQSVGSRSNALAGASVTLADLWAYYNNPGALGEYTDVAVGLTYENRFLLKELQQQAFAMTLPLKTGVVSAGAQTYGYRQFRSQRIGLGYSMRLADKLFAGVQVNYQLLQLNENYGSHSTVTAEAGIQALITTNWRFGMSVMNIGRSQLNTYQDERYPTLFRIGTSYQLSPKVLFLLEGSKTIVDKEKVKIGVEYQAVKDFFLRFGVSSQPVEVSFGFGYRWKIFLIDASSSYHPYLGWSPQLSLTYIHIKK